MSQLLGLAEPCRYPTEIVLDAALRTVHLTMAVLPALIFAWHGVMHEIRWRRRLGAYSIISGTIVGHVDINDYPHARIEYEVNGTTDVFVATHCFAEPKIGEQTLVAYNERTGAVDQYSYIARWFFTVFPIVFAGCWFGFFMMMH